MTLRSLAELQAHPELLEPPRTVAPLAVAGRVTLLTLGPKCGKSTTLAGLVAEASRRGVRCAILTLDEAPPDTVQRLIRFAAAPDAVFLDDVFRPETLEEDLVAAGVELLGVDHIGKLAAMHADHGAGTAGDGVLWDRLLAPLVTLARTHDMAVVLLDQSRRSDGKYSGSAHKAGSVDILAEMAQREGGLEAVPVGRVYLAPVRVELDAAGVPRFSGSASTAEAPARAGDPRATALLQLLSDAEPEGLTSAAWEKVSELPKTSYHRLRRALLREGLALSPAETRTRRYRVSERGEGALGEPLSPLVPEVPTSAVGTNGTPGRSSANGAKHSKECWPDGTSPMPGTVPVDEIERGDAWERPSVPVGARTATAGYRGGETLGA